MARAWLIDSRGLAKKVKNAGLPVAYQIKDCGAKKDCPNCHYCIDNTDVSHEWPGLPVGVKFDPTDIELLDHLAAKCGVGDSVPHLFINEFIPTLEGEEGICYTHPENLPGAKKDGSSVHFFYRIFNAYASGQRKRRRIHGQQSSIKAHVRWHKTGKTRPVMENAIVKGFQKIMVLYAPSRKGSKPRKCNWVMYQYHLGANEDEQEGEYVVSKIFYKPQKDTDYNGSSFVIEETDAGIVPAVPKTPKLSTPEPPRPQNTPSFNGGSDDYFINSFVQNAKNLKDPDPPSDFGLENEVEYATCLAGESQVAEYDCVDSLFCNETIDSNIISGDSKRPNYSLASEGHDVIHPQQRDVTASCGISDLDNIELDTPPDFNLLDLQFASQDSVFDWLNQL